MPDPTTLGDLAATGPAARGVLLRHQLDFCCRGATPLAEACARAGLDPDRVLAEVTAASRGTPAEDYATWPLGALVEHVLSRYHKPLPGLLDAVIAAAAKVETVHADKATCPRGLAAHLRGVRAAVLDHLDKEEQILFPAIAAGRGGEMDGPVAVMIQEHDEHGVNLRKIRTLTADLTLPADACATWRGLYEQLAHLESELMAHIHLENHTLFPRALAEGA